jgi:hypothetical protein
MSGWIAFSVIGVLGVLLAFSFLSFAGPLAWPVVVIIGAIVIWTRPPARAWLGLIAGIGAFLLFIGIIHIGDTPCAAIGGMVSHGPGDEPYSCGGLDAKPWLIIGSVVLAIAVGSFARARRSVMSNESP